MARETTLYEDAGNGFAYERGEYARRSVICEVLGGMISVRLPKREGSFAPDRRVHTPGAKRRKHMSRERPGERRGGRLALRGGGGRITVRLAESTGETTVEVRF